MEATAAQGLVVDAHYEYPGIRSLDGIVLRRMWLSHGPHQVFSVAQPNWSSSRPSKCPNRPATGR
jgi:hypothetical protein